MLKSLRAGITMVRDLGFHDMNLYSKQAVEQGIFPGPRLKVCATRSSRRAGTPTGSAAKPPAPTRCAARCASR